MNRLRTLRPVLVQLRTLQYTCRNSRRLLCAVSEPLPIPQDDTTKDYSANVQRLAEDISQLTLLETSQLNELLKSKLNIQDVPMMAPGMVPAAATGSVPEGEKEAAPKEEQTKFDVKLLKFDDGAKIKLIKEIKGIVEGVNLVQAKKFVEELPQTVKQNISKEEAAKLKERLEAAGGVVEIH